jgi:cation transport ATPase
MSQPAAENQYELFLEDPRVFGTDCVRGARLFARRILGVPELKALFVEPAAGRARLSYQALDGQRKSALSRLADAAQSDGHLLDEASMPMPPSDQPWLVVPRAYGILLLTVDDRQPGRWLIRHPWFQSAGRQLGKRLNQALMRISGVRAVRIEATEGKVEVIYNPATASLGRMTRVLEQVLAQERQPASAQDPASVPMALSNTTVGISTVGEILLPVATPVAAGVLIASNLGVVRDAAVQLTRGKVGVPLFHTALLTCSIVTGQVLAFALTDWSLRYWQRRWRKQLGDKTQALVDATALSGDAGRLIDGEGRETVIPTEALQPGQTLRVLAGETVAVDGRVTAGYALIAESLPSGVRTPARKSPGDPVLAGTLLLAGGIDVLAERVGQDTQVSQLGRQIGNTARVIAADSRLKGQATALADQTALPTLATAGVGWMVGDLITVGAILHQDWVSGPDMAVPLTALSQMRAALDIGALILNPAVLGKLAGCHFLVLDGDHPHLAEAGLDLVEIRSQMEDGKALLQDVAGAGLYLGGDIAMALAEACRGTGLVIRQPELIGLEPDGVQVHMGQHSLRCVTQVTNRGVNLDVERDGSPVGSLILERARVPLLAKALPRLRGLGLEIFLMSSAGPEVTADLAERLGVPLHGSDMDDAQKTRFLDGLRQRGQTTIYAGRVTGQVDYRAHADVTIAVESLGGSALPADIVMLGGRFDNLPEVLETAREFEPAIRRATRSAGIPNLLCVAGGFGGLLNGITSGIIANVGVMNVDRQLRRSLSNDDTKRHQRLTQMLR